MTHRSLPALIVATVALWWCSTPATFADWLVTRDGAKIETDGPWRVEGRRVLFDLPNGTLSALRLSEVDLEASEEATLAALENARKEEEPTPKEKKPLPEPILVLTDKDIPRAAPDVLADDQDDEGEPAADEGNAPGADLRVTDWSTETDGDALIVVGRLENTSSSLQNDIRLTVELRDEEGQVLASAIALLQQQSLIAGANATFKARFADMTELEGSPHFAVESTKFAVRGGTERALDQDEDG